MTTHLALDVLQAQVQDVNKKLFSLVSTLSQSIETLGGRGTGVGPA